MANSKREGDEHRNDGEDRGGERLQLRRDMSLEASAW